jgi:anti-anti-sigma factor
MFVAPSRSEVLGVIRVVPEKDRIVAVCLEGELDLANVPALGEEIDGVLARGNDLIVDLSEVTFIDCSVIRVLFNAAQAADGLDQTMVIQLGTGPTVQRILKIVGIEQVLPRAHGREEAVRIIERHAARRSGKESVAARPRDEDASHTSAHPRLIHNAMVLG